MTIIRNVNGQEVEFELTFSELIDAHNEYEFDSTYEDVLTRCVDIPELTEKDIHRITNMAIRYLSKNDYYYEAYWDSVDNAIDDFMKNKTK